MSKAVIIFLIFIMIMGMMGRLRLPQILQRKRVAAEKCKKCGSLKLPKTPCNCETKKNG